MIPSACKVAGKLVLSYVVEGTNIFRKGFAVYCHVSPKWPLTYAFRPQEFSPGEGAK